MYDGDKGTEFEKANDLKNSLSVWIMKGVTMYRIEHGAYQVLVWNEKFTPDFEFRESRATSKKVHDTTFDALKTYSKKVSESKEMSLLSGTFEREPHWKLSVCFVRMNVSNFDSVYHY